MKQHYEKRIRELEKEIKTLETSKAEEGPDPAALDLFARHRRDHIQCYREFIKKALIIKARTEPNTRLDPTGNSPVRLYQSCFPRRVSHFVEAVEKVLET